MSDLIKQRPIIFSGLFVLFLIATGCRESTPPDLIDEETYIDLLAEIHLLAAIRDHYDDETMYVRIQQSILDHYDITRDQFIRSHDYYHLDMDAQLRRLSEARAIFDGLSQSYFYKFNLDPKQEADTDKIRPKGILESRLPDVIPPSIHTTYPLEPDTISNKPL